MFGNLSTHQQIIRYGTGAALIVLSAFTLQIPLWFALAATYPIFTALVQWDPLYALFAVIRRQLTKELVPAKRSYRRVYSS